MAIQCGGGQCGQGQPAAVIALDGDKLKPREDQRKGGNGFGINEEGADYTLTGVDRHGVAYGIGNGQAAEATIAAKECCQTLNTMHDHQAVCFENHAQDSRVRPIEVSDTRNQKDGTGGNNLPLVVHRSQVPFVKTSHASGKGGLGEKWERCEVAGTRNAIEGNDGRNQECIVSTAFKLDSTASNSMKSKNPHSGFHEEQVAACLDTTTPDPSKNQGGNVIVSTNSNGEDVAPTVNANMSKLGGDNQTTFGGGIASHGE